MLASLAILSAALLGYEVVLVHLFSISHWSHFASLVISLALLGFGASGSLVAVLRGPLAGRERTAFRGAVLVSALAFDPAYRLAAAIPFDAFELMAVPRQFFYLVATYLFLSIPFLMGGAAVALAFLIGRDRIGRVYGANLAGSGAGAVLGLLLLARLPAELLPTALGVIGSLAIVPLARWGALVPAAALGLAFLLPPISIPVSDYKEESVALELPAARVVVEEDGPLGRLRVVAGPALRYLPGTSLALSEPVPPRPVLYLDGQPLGALVTAGDTALLAMTTSAAAFAIARDPAPRVLVLGMGGGGPIHLARAAGASSITVVEPDRRIDPLLPAGTLGGDVRRAAGTPRGFLAASEAHFDRIVVAEIGSLHGGAAGMAAAGASYLFTVEGVQAMWEALGADGILAITRWVLDPPRDMLRLLATVDEVLDAAGVRSADHVALVRGWGTATLLVSRKPFTPQEVAALVDWAGELWFDVAWAPGAPAALANRYNVLEPDFYRAGTEELLGPRPGRFLEDYPFQIAPVTDDAPFFFHFLSPRQLVELWQTGGRLSLPYVEWGIVTQVLVLIQAVPIAALLLLLPLITLGRERATVGAPSEQGGRTTRGALFIYFALLGLAFMLLEVSSIQRLILFLAQPIYATTVVLATFLLFAGLGSAARSRLAGRWPAWLPFAAIAFLAPLVHAAELALWGRMAGTDLSVRVVLAIALLAPLAFCMGLPFPMGLQRVADRRPRWVPWCWGVNGFLSVIGAAAAPLVALAIGFRGTLLLAVLFYLAAGWTYRRL
ncbi:hypothetical protein BH18GEM1_BH18GEM1_15850 [soil metagenome]